MKFAQTCFFCQQPLTWGYNSLVWPYAYQTWIVGGIFHTLWIFYQDLVHHPDHWASVLGPFIFRSCMVWHLQFFPSIASQLFSLMVHLRFGHVSVAPVAVLVGPILVTSLHTFTPLAWGTDFLGFYFCCHPGSWFIIRFHCEGFNHTYFAARLLGTSLESLVLWGCLFSGTSLSYILYFQYPYQIHRL